MKRKQGGAVELSEMLQRSLDTDISFLLTSLMDTTVYLFQTVFWAHGSGVT